MPKLTFFRQARVDGGIRTGIDIDGTTTDIYESGTGEFDPALVWFVDLRLKGENLPTRPEEARQWLLNHKEFVTEAYLEHGKKLKVGMDPDVWPLRSEIPDAVPGEQLTASVCSSTSAPMPAREMGNTVRDLAEHWQEYLSSVFRVQTPSH